MNWQTLDSIASYDAALVAMRDPRQLEADRLDALATAYQRAEHGHRRAARRRLEAEVLRQLRSGA